jgi:hypothetical protein
MTVFDPVSFCVLLAQSVGSQAVVEVEMKDRRK